MQTMLQGGAHIMDYASIGKSIRLLRKQRHMTQEYLAERIGRSVSFVGHIERGSRKMSIETLIAIADALETSTDVLLGRNLYATEMKTSAQQLLEMALEMAAHSKA